MVNTDLRVRAHVPGALRVSVETLGGRRVVMARSSSGHHRGALTRNAAETFAAGARMALEYRLPLVICLASSGSDVNEGINSLDGWGRAAAAVARCSGSVPILAVVSGPAISGPALMLGMADIVAMTPDAFAFVSGPNMVEGFTGIRVGLSELGGVRVHSTSTGLCALPADDVDHALDLLSEVLGFLPDHSDLPPPAVATTDSSTRPNPDLLDLIPASPTASYDVRDLIAEVADNGELLELRAGWAPQLVTALTSIGGIAIGVIANQPRSMAGTLDIPASQKGARFVRMCDSFNLPILTLVDTPGFLPGKDLEWRGMIRHGAELAFAYAEASVPRVCLILRKAYGGAYIVMDSKGMGNDLCLAWPTAEVAVMGAQGAVQILHRGVDESERIRLEEEYKSTLLTPWIAAERGFIDLVIDPTETRAVLAESLATLWSRREMIHGRKHESGPL